ncbi:MAG TPA: guanine permease [Firmicutes bacterium]|nr:guanine permease [Bacillota bacterium]
MLEKLFKLKENGTTVKTEIFAGLVSFMTMAYIIFVNPGILSAAGMDFQAVTVATCLAAGLSTLIMALLSNYPFTMAAGMGLNGVVAFSLVLSEGLTWQAAMGVVFLEGIIITILVLTNIREWIMDAIPINLKRAIGVGIGLFIAFLGLKNAGFVVSSDATLISRGIFSVQAIVAALGLIVTAVLMARRVKGAILFGIILTTVFAYLSDVIIQPDQLLVTLPKAGEIFRLPQAQDFSTIFKLDIAGAFKASLVLWVFSLLITDFFDTMGTVVAVGGKAGYLDKNGKLPRMNKVLLADSLGAVIGGLFGCSSNTTYVESASGVAEGGRTGLTGVVVALLFFVSIFLAPLVGIVPGVATAPALIIVGYLMMGVVKDIDWDKMDEAFPAFLTILVIPMTGDISWGIGFGFITYVLLKMFQGKFKEVHPLMYVTALLFLIHFALTTVKALGLI